MNKNLFLTGMNIDQGRKALLGMGQNVDSEDSSYSSEVKRHVRGCKNRGLSDHQFPFLRGYLPPKNVRGDKYGTLKLRINLL